LLGLVAKKGVTAIECDPSRQMQIVDYLRYERRIDYRRFTRRIRGLPMRRLGLRKTFLGCVLIAAAGKTIAGHSGKP